jgi:hypothetical protein
MKKIKIYFFDHSGFALFGTTTDESSWRKVLDEVADKANREKWEGYLKSKIIEE